MQKELFNVEESLSPRLRWMREKGVQVKKRNDLADDLPPWEAWIGDYGDTVLKVFGNGETLDGQSCDPDYNPDFVFGESEDEVITEIAKRNEWRLWNEG